MFTVSLRQALFALFVLLVVALSAIDASAQCQQIKPTVLGAMDSLVKSEKSPWLLHALQDPSGKPLHPAGARTYRAPFYCLPKGSVPNKKQSRLFIAAEVKAYGGPVGMVSAKKRPANLPLIAQPTNMPMEIVIENYDSLAKPRMAAGEQKTIEYRIQYAGQKHIEQAIVLLREDGTTEVVKILNESPGLLTLKAMNPGLTHVVLKSKQGEIIKTIPIEVYVAPPMRSFYEEWAPYILVFGFALWIVATVALFYSFKKWLRRERAKISEQDERINQGWEELDAARGVLEAEQVALRDAKRIFEEEKARQEAESRPAPPPAPPLPHQLKTAPLPPVAQPRRRTRSRPSA